MQGANWNFIIDQGATEAFALDFQVTHQLELSWDDNREHRPIILTADEPPLTGTPEEDR